MLMLGSVEHSYSELIEVSNLLTDEVKGLAKATPEKEPDAQEYLVNLIRMAEERKDFEDASKVQGMAIFGLYLISPWGKTLKTKAFHNWCESKGLEAEMGATILSLVREFQGWEPGIAEDFALVIELDRAVIRGSRVGARSMNPEAFVEWFERNYERVGVEERILHEAKKQLQLLRGLIQGSRESVADAQNELKRIARNVLRDVGRKFGRSGLNSVRRQIGAAPSARRPSNEAIGATYSDSVYQLSEIYLNLNASEREAFKHLISKLDTGVSLERS